MSDEQQPREIRIIADPVRGENYARIITEGEEVRTISVEPAEKWSDDDVRVALTQHDVRGSNTQVVRFSDAEAQELFGKLATYLLGQGLLTVNNPPSDDEDVQAFDAARDDAPGWQRQSPFEIASFFWKAGLARGRKR